MKYILPLVFLFVASTIHAQIDTEFWFAAPDLTEGKIGEPRRDSTIYLVFSSFEQATTLIVTQPANPDFELIVVDLPPNSSDFINLGTFLSQIETKPANTILETGLLIRSTHPITAYYEVRGSNNSDIFALKGKNALGTKFYTPFQNEYDNAQTLGGSAYMPPPRSGFAIMATKNNTTVSITPTEELLGHPADQTFDITLNRGETYYCESLGFLGAEHPGGSKIESDKAIVVTIKDDMVDFDSSNDSGADVLGDQLISYEYLGLEHIIIKGGLDGNNDRAVVCATEDNTVIDIDGGSQTVNLNEGEQFIFPIAGEASFVSASAKIAVFHVSGLGNQTSGAIIPSLECTGSQQVGFVRGSNRPFFLNLTIRAGSESNFELNGNPTLIQAADFSPVPGSGGDYVFTRLSFNTTDVPVGVANSLTNFSDELFHLGTTNGNLGNSCNYGYFSAFSFLNVGKNRDVCLGDTLILDAGPGKTGYLWNTGEDTQSIEITEAGVYYVDVFSGSDCFATDTIEVNYYLPPVDLGPNDTICSGTSTTLEIAEGVFTYEWQDGSTENFFTTADSGIFWVDVSDFQGCTLRDSIHIALSDRPETPDVFGDSLYCEGENIALFMGDFDNAQYRYILPDGSLNFNQNLVIDNVDLSYTGIYQGYYVVEGCESFTDAIEIVVLENPQITLGPDISVCEDEPVVLDPGIVDGDLEWQDESTGETYSPITSGTYYVTLTSANECASTDTVEVEFRPLPTNPEITGETDYCFGESIVLNTSAQTDVSFIWTQPNGIISTNDGVFMLENAQEIDAGSYQVYAEIAACLSDTVSQIISVNPLPEFDLVADTIICNNEQLILIGPADMESYLWSTGEDDEFITVGPGNYSLIAINSFGCEGFAETNVAAQGPTAVFEILPDSITIPGETLSFVDLSETDGADITIWSWNFGTGDISSLQNPSYSYVNAGIFNVQLTVIDENNCSSQATHQVVSNFGFNVPEGFSPNGDGINDVFEIEGIEGLDGVAVQIFNRWGNTVFESSNYQPGNFWDGDDLPDGTYFYIVTLPNAEGMTGPITIAR